MAEDLATLGMRVDSDGFVVANKRMREMERQAGKTETASQKLIRQTDRMGKSMQSLGRTMSLSVTAPLVAAAAASVKFASDFESELTKVNTLVGVSREQISKYREQILELAPAVGRGPSELARGLFAVTSAGQRGAAAMETLEQAAKASAIGLGDTRDIALAATSAVTAYGEETLSSAEAVETMIGIVEQGNLEASALAGRLGNVIGLAKQTGTSFRDAGAFIAAFTRQGVSAEQAITGLRGTLALLAREPTSEAVSALGEIGLTMDELRANIQEQGFIVAFQDMVTRADEAGVSMARIIPEVEALAGSLAVFQSEGESAADIAESIGDAVGTLEDRLQAARESDPALAFAQMRSELETLGIEIGSNLLPVALELAGAIRDLSEWFRNLEAETQKNIIRTAGFAAAIGPALIALGAMVSSVGALIKAFRTLRTVMLSTPWGAIAIGISSIAGGLYRAHNTLEEMRQPTERAAGALERMQKATEGGLNDQSVRDYTNALFELNSELTEAIRQREMLARGPGPKNIARIEALDEQIEKTQQLREVQQARMEIAQQFPTQAERDAAAQQLLNNVMSEGREILEGFGISLPQAADATTEAGEAAGTASGGTEEYARSLEDAKERIEELAEAQATFMESVEDIEASLAGDTATAMLEYRRSVAEANQLFAEGAITLGQYMRALDAFQGQMNQGTGGGQGMFPDFGVLDSALDGMKDIREEMEEAAQIEWSFEGLIDSFHPLSQAMRQLGDDIATVNAQIEKGDLSNMEGMFVKTGAAANAAFGAIMSGMDRSSKEYEQMQVAQQAVNVALGIAAILQQGMGDPYTAIPRMIAMAAMVAQLVDGISGLSGGGGGAEQAQETQGTGSVLGDTEAKSESIANAVEVTADATSELVGINRSMAQSLRQLQDGLAGASNMIARRGDVDYGPMDLDLGTFNDISNDIWDPFGFFGSTKVKDEGIELLGGAIADMTEGAVGVAFQTVKKSGLFGSSTDTGTSDLSDALNDQLNLIFESMISTVESAGEALGIPLDEIQARIDAFEVAAQEISLKDLDGEEQQAELEAVFSRIFDDLASSVIPFIDQFQQIGEGMGETLVRVATSVQVTEEAITRLGLSISDSLGPERMAQVSVGLVEAAGGIDEFITGMENFISKFAPEAHQFDIAQSDITRALDQMGMALPRTRDGFWELIQAIDGSTEAGQRQIATLLGLTEAADTYYSNIEAIEEERAGLLTRLLEINGDTNLLRQRELEQLDESNQALQERIWALEDEAELADLMADVNQSLLQEMSPAHAELSRIVSAYAGMTARARELGASEEQLMRIRQLHSAQLAAFGETLRASIADSVDSLFGSDGMSSSMSSTASSVSGSMDNIRDSMIRALESVRDWLDSSMLSDTSPLVPQERLNEAERQFNEAFAAAQGGDVDAMSDLPGLADQFLSEAGGFFGTSTSEFDQIWMQVRDAMSQIADMEAPDAGPPTYGQMSNVESATDATAKTAYEQLLEAQHLIGQIDALSRITGDSPAEIADELGVPMGDLIELMGGNPEATAGALETQFNDLVTGFGENLDPLMGIEREQLTELRALNATFASIIETAGISVTDSPPDGPSNAPIPTPPQTESNNEASEETNERLARLEEILEGIAQSGNQTASNTGLQSRRLGDLVIINREMADRRDSPRIRS